MSVWVIILIILATVAVANMTRNRHGKRDNWLVDEESEQYRSTQRENELQQEVEQLRKRIEVLERIATEDSEAKRLSAEIERLRNE